MVREFDRHQHQHLDLVLDLWQPARPTRDDRQRVELAVSLAATLCVETLRQSSDARVALTVWGEGVSELNDLAGPSGVNELLDLLATVRPGANALEDRTLRPPVSAHPLGVLVTTRPELAPEWTQAEGRDARMPVHVDPERLPSWFAIGEA